MGTLIYHPLQGLRLVCTVPGGTVSEPELGFKHPHSQLTFQAAVQNSFPVCSHVHKRLWGTSTSHEYLLSTELEVKFSVVGRNINLLVYMGGNRHYSNSHINRCIIVRMISGKN